MTCHSTSEDGFGRLHVCDRQQGHDGLHRSSTRTVRGEWAGIAWDEGRWRMGATLDELYASAGLVSSPQATPDQTRKARS